ncbi:MAG TPA: DMT family transporter [Gemmatimonadales bacterium]|nr:DMT family transporter [Gemmatimonadales bacterium]
MTRRQGVAALVFIAIVWGCSFTIIKQTLALASPFVLLALRFLLASLLVAPWFRGLTRRELVGGVVLGLLFWAGFVFQTFGLQYTTPSRSAFMTGLSTPLVPVACFMVYRRPPSVLVVLAVVITGLGMYLLTRPGGMSEGLNRGDLLTLGCAALFALQIVAVGHFARVARPTRLLAMELGLTGVLSLLAVPALETPRLTVAPPLLLALAFLSVTAALTFYLQVGAQRVVSPAAAAIIFTLESLAAAVTSWLVLGEVLTPAQWLGGLLILGGAVLPFLTPAWHRLGPSPVDGPEASSRL